MRNHSYSQEAKRCRELAVEFQDNVQGPFLLRVAETFDGLAQDASSSECIAEPSEQPSALRSLPAVDTKRWTPRRKAEVVAAVADGLLSVEDACRRYSLSFDEFSSWQRAIDRGGVAGLRVTRLQHYRDY